MVIVIVGLLKRGVGGMFLEREDGFGRKLLNCCGPHMSRT